jgi:hypothetical protein
VFKLCFCIVIESVIHLLQKFVDFLICIQNFIPFTGLAFIGSLCRPNGDSVSIVEDNGGFQNIGTAAHELGHR